MFRHLYLCVSIHLILSIFSDPVQEVWVVSVPNISAPSISMLEVAVEAAKKGTSCYELVSLCSSPRIDSTKSS